MRIDVADPEQMDAWVRGLRQAPGLQEQVEALAQVGIAQAHRQQRALGQPQPGPHRRRVRRSDCDRAINALRQHHRPALRHGDQLVEPVADVGCGKHHVLGHRGPAAGPLHQAALPQQARQLVHQQRAGDAGLHQGLAGARCSRGVDDRVAKAPGRRRLRLPRQVLQAGQDRGWPDRPVLRRERAVAQKQERDLDAPHMPQVAAEVQQQHLRARRPGVMPHQQQPPASGVQCQPGHRAPGGVQIGGAEMHVGFEVCALRPLVPGVHADDCLTLDRLRDRGGDQAAEPGLIGGRGRSVQHHAGALPPGVVVPARQGGADQRIRRRGQVRRCRRVVIGIHPRRRRGVQHAQPSVQWFQTVRQLVRRELDRRVHSERTRIAVVEALRHDEDRILAVLAEQRAPPRHGSGGSRDQPRAIHHQDRPAAEPDVSHILEVPQQFRHQRRLVRRAVVLRDQHLVLGPVPTTGPVLVRPHQAERQIHRRIGQQGVQRRIQQAAAVEPIEIEHEAMHPSAACQLGLPTQRLRALQPVVPEVTRNARLVVPGKTRQATCHVGPFGEALAPPGVVFRHRMILRQVKRQQLHQTDGVGRQRLHLLEQRSRLRVAPHLRWDVAIGGGAGREHAGLMAMPAVVQQRIGARQVAQVALAIERAVEP